MVAAGRQFYQQVTCIQEKRVESGYLAKQSRLDTGSQEREEYKLGVGMEEEKQWALLWI